jgi:hypothetical protein
MLPRNRIDADVDQDGGRIHAMPSSVGSTVFLRPKFKLADYWLSRAGRRQRPWPWRQHKQKLQGLHATPVVPARYLPLETAAPGRPSYDRLQPCLPGGWLAWGYCEWLTMALIYQPSFLLPPCGPETEPIAQPRSNVSDPTFH